LIPIFNFKNFGWLNSYQINCAKYCECNVHIYDATIFYKFSHRLEEAAALDGLGSLQTFFQIVLPLAKPTGCTNNIYFMGTWNNFLTPLIIMSDSEMFTLPLGFEHL